MSDKNVGELIGQIFGPSDEEKRKASRYLVKALRLACPFIESLQTKLKEEKQLRLLSKVQKRIDSLLECLGELSDDDSVDDSIQKALKMLKSALDEVKVDRITCTDVASVVKCALDLHEQTGGTLNVDAMRRIENDLAG